MGGFEKWLYNELTWNPQEVLSSSNDFDLIPPSLLRQFFFKSQVSCPLSPHAIKTCVKKHVDMVWSISAKAKTQIQRCIFFYTFWFSSPALLFCSMKSFPRLWRGWGRSPNRRRQRAAGEKFFEDRLGYPTISMTFKRALRMLYS